MKATKKYGNLFLLSCIFTAGLFAPGYSYAQSDCNNQNSEVCEHAQSIAFSMAPHFPMRINGNTVIQTIYASGSTVYLNSRFDYSEKEMKNVFGRTGASEEEALSAISRVAKSSICNPSSETYRFVESGGSIVYSYFFIDGKKYSDIEIDGC